MPWGKIYEGPLIIAAFAGKGRILYTLIPVLGLSRGNSDQGVAKNVIEQYTI